MPFIYTFSNPGIDTILNSVSYIGSGSGSGSGSDDSTVAVLPSTVTTIGSFAFSTSSVTSILTNVDFGLTNNLNDIELGAFQNCEKLTSIIIPNTVSNIYTHAFNYCTSLTNINLPSYPFKPNLGLNSFSNTRSINLINYSTLKQMNVNNRYSKLELITAGFDILAIDQVCGVISFKKGSKILTDNGYVAIENLKNGDLVKTLMNDYKPIYMIGCSEINNIASQQRINNQLYKCSNTEYPEIIEDLIIMGYHAILIDSFVSKSQEEKTIIIYGEIYVTDNKYCLPVCVDERSRVYEEQGIYTVYHLALENDDYYNNYGIYANGLLVASCSKNLLNNMSLMREYNIFINN